jgi:diguanylate cyclase (GGDEF)-like protein/PAS domain S-box-containing protein
MGRIDRSYVAIGGVASVAVFLVPTRLGGDVLFTLVALSVPAVGWWALHHDRPQPRRGWLLLTLGFTVVALAELSCLVLYDWGWWRGAESAINVSFILGYIVQFVGLTTIINSRSTRRSRASWLDAGAVGVATLTTIWTTCYEQLIERNGRASLEWLIALSEPMIGVALAAMALRLVLGEPRGYRVFGLLAFGYAVQTATDVTASLVEGDWQRLLNGLWAVSYVCFGANLLHPRRLLPPREAPSALARREVMQALALQGAVIVAVIGAIVGRARSLVPASILVVWVIAAMVMLVLNRVRVYSLVRLVGDASATESHRRLTALVDNSHEIIALADSEGVLRYVSSSVEFATGLPASHWLGANVTRVLTEQLFETSDRLSQLASLAPGERFTWESDMRPRESSTPARTLQLTVVNHVDTPEVNGWVITIRDVTDEARLTSELRHQALHDTLTGLPNRALLFDRIEHALERAQLSPDTSIAVALVDLDEFKSVNDSLGHDTGDVLLQGVAERLLHAVRPGDTVARLGGDEFALLLEGADELEAMAIAQRALESVAQPVQLGDVDFSAAASVGVVCHRGPADPVELLRFADIAMYEAKREGKARAKLFREHMHHAAKNQLELRMNLAAALERDELSLVFQPIVDLSSYEVRGVEALLRWHHPVRGAVPPAEFIPIAEQSGLLEPIGEWVLRTACAHAATWPSISGSAPYLSVNVSAAQISSRGFVQKVMSALAASGLPASRLLLEVTETMLVDDGGNASDVLAQLRAVGIRIAIDDFGTGYSSLAYLRQLAVDVVKIDQSFVRDVDTNSDHQALTRTMLALADGLSMTAIAEGVETTDELGELRLLGCGFAQGYLFSYPVPAEALLALLEQPRAEPALGGR